MNTLTKQGLLQTDFTAQLTAIEGKVDIIDTLVDFANEHNHNWERWFGLANVPNAEIHRADRIGTTTTVFQMDAGNVTWGTWLQILGSSDTPVDAGMLRYDLHRVYIKAVERLNADHYIQVGFGASGAAALAAGTYTEFVYHPQSAITTETPIDVRVKQALAGTKAWIRVMIPGQNTGTVDFYIGLHEYDE